MAIIEETVRIGKEPIQKPGRSKQDYGTPMAFIRAVEAKFGPLVCDLACTRENRKAPEGYYFPETDSLKQAWAEHHPEGNLWLNPPFADIGTWAAKCEAEGMNRRHGGIFLLTPASIGSNWFAKHVHKKARVLGLSPRLTFEGTKDPYPKDLMLSIFGLAYSGFDVWRWDAAAPSESKDQP